MLEISRGSRALLRIGLCFLLVVAVAVKANVSVCKTGATGSVHDYKLTAIDGVQEIDLASKYNNKVLLIANIAAFCDGQEMLHYNALVEEFGGDFAILAIPCNLFGLQMPGTETEYLNAFRYVRPGNNYIPLFDVTKKYDVNGPSEDPLFTYLKTNCAGASQEMGDPARYYWSPIKRDDIPWNFEKFLIDKTGQPVKRYRLGADKSSLEDDIRGLLSMTSTLPASSSPALSAGLWTSVLLLFHVFT